jgi:DNA-binding PadR family transcriptional regulator
MARHRHDDWGFEDMFRAGFTRGDWGSGWRAWTGPGGRRRRTQVFESGDMKFVILRLLKERPRHGYDIIKALEEKMWGCYSPSAGTIYPTLQLLEDQGYVRGVETDGRRVYHITPEGERFLEEHRHLIEEIFERVRETVRDFVGGDMGELNGAFASLATSIYKRAWRKGPEHPSIKRVAEILRRAQDDVERAWDGPSGSESKTPS